MNAPGVHHRHTGKYLMRPPGQRPQHCARIGLTGWLSENHIVERNTGVGTEHRQPRLHRRNTLRLGKRQARHVLGSAFVLSP
jgi:hypothetical protein